MKPIVNLDELEMKQLDKGAFKAMWAGISGKIGAKLLGYNVTVVPPGKSAVPYHVHHNNEEMVLILDGTGTLRFGNEEYPLRKHDVAGAGVDGDEGKPLLRHFFRAGSAVDYWDGEKS